MTIHHTLNDFLYSLFPDAEAFGQSSDRLVEHLTDFYTYGPYRPKVTIDKNVVTVQIDTQAITNQQGEYNKVLKMCQEGQFLQAQARRREGGAT